MAIYELRKFSDIVSAAMEQMRVQSTDTVTKNRIKRDINMIYLNEVVPYHPWKWLDGNVTVVLDSKFITGTATVTQGSATVTLTTAPANSRKGELFATDGTNEIYTIAEHTANSTTVTLDTPYLGETDSGLSFKIWTYKLPLPVDCRQTKSVYHDYSDIPLDAVSMSDFEKYSNTNQRSEARPAFYTTADYIDASSYESISGLPALSTRASDGLIKTLVFASDVSDYLDVGDRIRISSAGHYSYNGEFVIRSVSTTTVTYVGKVVYTESATSDASLTVKLQSSVGASERYRELWVWPSAYTSKTNLHVSYIKDPAPLEADDDEPLMPLSDRSVLLYGALMQSWSRERNPEEAQRNAVLYERKLAKMLGKFDDAGDTPLLRPSHVYLGAKRSQDRRRTAKYEGYDGSGGSSSSSQTIRGTASTVAVFDANGELGSSSTVSTTELNRLDGISSTAVGISDTQTLTNKTIDADSNTITNIENADIKTGAAIARAKLASGTADHVLINDASGVMSSEAALSPVRGGTGIANNAAATLTRSGNHALTITTSNTTNVTLPTTGTLSTLAGSETLTNKSIDADTNTITNIENADIKAGAAIARNKLASGTADHVLINDASGVMSSEAALSPTRGGTGVANNSAATLTRSGNHALTLTTSNTTDVTLPTTGTLATLAGSETLTNKTLTTPTINQPTINGVTDGSSAGAGVVGEYMSSTFSGTSAGTSGQFADMTSLALTAGEWLIWFQTYADKNGATVGANIFNMAISANSGNTTTDHVLGDNRLIYPYSASTGDAGSGMVHWRRTLSGAATYYAKTSVTYTVATPNFSGKFWAMRIR